jgi:uncharacterized protein YdaU (DUF1376 family)
VSLPYYKRFPRDFLDGTIGLCLETKGAYAIVLDLIYMRDGRLSDDARYIAGQLGCSVRKWTAIRNELLEAGKIQCANGVISNFRADYLTEESRKYQDKQREIAGLPRKNKGLEKPSVIPKPSQSESESDSKIETTSLVRPKPNDALPHLFLEAWGAYPSKGRERSKSQAKTLPIWREAAKASGGPERLLGAVRRYVSQDQTHKGDCGPPAFDKWLRDGRWEHWLPQAGTVAGLAPMNPELQAQRRALLMGTEP